jgi:hypothetical protein
MDSPNFRLNLASHLSFPRQMGQRPDLQMCRALACDVAAARSDVWFGGLAIVLGRAVAAVFGRTARLRASLPKEWASSAI